MLEAAKGLVPILVDCSKRGDHGDLKQKYGVRGYPTVVFCDAEGTEVARLGSRAPADVKRQIEEVVAAHTKPAFLEVSLAEAKQAATEGGKLVAAIFLDDSPKHEEKNAAVLEFILSDAFEDVRERFVWVKRPIKDADGKKTKEARGMRATRSPTLVLIDPAAQEPDDGVLDRVTSFKRLHRDLEKVLEDR